MAPDLLHTLFYHFRVINLKAIYEIKLNFVCKRVARIFMWSFFSAKSPKRVMAVHFSISGQQFQGGILVSLTYLSFFGV